MHSPILFAYTEQAEGLDDLKHAKNKQAVIDCFVEYGADSDTVFEHLQEVSLADWMYDYEDDQGWNAMKLLNDLGDGATFTPVNDFYGWLTVSPEKCRELLGQGLDAAIELLTLSRQMLTDGVKKVDVYYPSLSSSIPDEMKSRISTLRNIADNFGISPRNYVDGMMFVIVDEDSSIRIGTFGQLVTHVVSCGEGIRLAVAHCFAGDYHY